MNILFWSISCIKNYILSYFSVELMSYWKNVNTILRKRINYSGHSILNFNSPVLKYFHILILLFLPASVMAQQHNDIPKISRAAWVPDLGNDEYKNPIIYAD